MTHVSLAPRARPNAVITALTALNSENPPTTMAGDPKATCFDKPPRDLSDVYTSAVCVEVPDFEINAAAKNAAMNLLEGSTMNGRYVDDAAAKKLLADKKVYADGNFLGGTLTIGNKAGKGFGKSHTGRSATSRDINGLLREAHHGVQVGITDVPVRTEGRDRAMHHVH